MHLSEVFFYPLQVFQRDLLEDGHVFFNAYAISLLQRP